jgi:hypothetical protein
MWPWSKPKTTVAEALFGKSKSKLDCRHESTKVIMKMNKQIRKNDKKTAKAIKKHDTEMKKKYEKLLKEAKKMCKSSDSSDSSDSDSDSSVSDSSDSESSDSDSSDSERKKTRRRRSTRNNTSVSTKNVKVYFTVERIGSRGSVQPSMESYSAQTFLKQRASQLSSVIRPFVKSVTGYSTVTSKNIVYTGRITGSKSDIRRAIKSFPLSNTIGGIYRFKRFEERIS